MNWYIEYKILYVPGALEIAPAIKLVFDKSLKNPLFDGFIALGCVLKEKPITSKLLLMNLQELYLIYVLTILYQLVMEF